MEIIIVDDHALYRSGLNFLLNSTIPGSKIFEYDTVSDVIQHFRTHSAPNLIILDLQLPDLPGFTALQLILEFNPEQLVTIISSSESISDMKMAFHLGARGYILKTETPDVMQNAFNLILAGGTYIPAIFTRYQEHYIDNELDISLTPKQLEVLKFIQKGFSNKQIADSMDLALNTVKVHTTAIFKQLGAKNRTQAVLIANNLGI